MALNVAKEVAALERMSVNDLCERYRDTFGEETNARNKRWLVKRIAWKLQANAEGDISERARRLATEIALSTDIRSSAPKIRRRPTVETLTTASTIITPPADCRLPSPGTTLLKTYKGRDVQVRVLPNSFEFEGEQYKTLTAIARIVTGQPNINGYQFFKLGRRPETGGRRQEAGDWRREGIENYSRSVLSVPVKCLSLLNNFVIYDCSDGRMPELLRRSENAIERTPVSRLRSAA